MDAVAPSEPTAALTPGAGQPTLHSRMTRLLERAIDQSSRASRLELYDRLLGQLVADEARIISALSDGSASPLINVYARARSIPVLENIALVGRSANIALPDMVSQYVGHLLALGLVETGPEDPALKTDYEILGAETVVLRAIKDASVGPVPARVERLTLRLSTLGQSLWDATMDESGS